MVPNGNGLIMDEHVWTNWLTTTWKIATESTTDLSSPSLLLFSSVGLAALAVGYSIETQKAVAEANWSLAENEKKSVSGIHAGRVENIPSRAFITFGLLFLCTVVLSLIGSLKFLPPSLKSFLGNVNYFTVTLTILLLITWICINTVKGWFDRYLGRKIDPSRKRA